MATPTGFEPAISTVTGWHVKPLHHGADLPNVTQCTTYSILILWWPVEAVNILWCLSMQTPYNARSHLKVKSMPKKYHRPPATKRRKSKKSSTAPRVLEPLPEDDTDHSTAVVEDAAPDDLDEVNDDAEETVEAVPSAAFERQTQVSHLVMDYAYVLKDIRLSLGLAAFLIVAIGITALFL